MVAVAHGQLVCLNDATRQLTDTMSDRDNSRVAQGRLQNLKQLLVRGHVHASEIGQLKQFPARMTPLVPRRRLIKHDDAALLQENARDAQQLALTAGELKAVRRDQGVKLSVEVLHSSLHADKIEGGPNLLIVDAFGAAEEKVVAEGRVEQEGRLRDSATGGVQ